MYLTLEWQWGALLVIVVFGALGFITWIVGTGRTTLREEVIASRAAPLFVIVCAAMCLAMALPLLVLHGSYPTAPGWWGLTVAGGLLAAGGHLWRLRRHLGNDAPPSSTPRAPEP